MRCCFWSSSRWFPDRHKERTMRAFGVALLTALLSLNVKAGLLVQEQTVRDASSSAHTASANNIILPDEEYVIGPTDVVQVSVLKMPELSREYRVSADGTIEMPFIGAIHADKKSSRELAVAIAKELQGSYLLDPQVSVVVIQVN